MAMYARFQKAIGVRTIQRIVGMLGVSGIPTLEGCSVQPNEEDWSRSLDDNGLKVSNCHLDFKSALCQAQSGNAEMQYKIGIMYCLKGPYWHPESDFSYDESEEMVDAWKKVGIYWLGKAAEQGYVEALYKLGLCCWNKYWEEDRDKTELLEIADILWKYAAAEYKDAAKRGDAMAQFRLGRLYKNGSGVPMNKKTAIDWLTKAANQGLLFAMMALVDSYGERIGNLKNYNEGRKWCEKLLEHSDKLTEERISWVREWMKELEEMHNDWKNRKPDPNKDALKLCRQLEKELLASVASR